MTRCAPGNGLVSPSRRTVLRIVGVGVLAPLAACGKGADVMKSEVYLDVVVHSYIDRPILDILFNGTDLGVAGAFGGTGTITGVRIPFGIQRLTWRLDGSKGMERLGETVVAGNRLIVREEDIPADTRYAGLHLYPDATAEVTFDRHIPELSARGAGIMRMTQGSDTER